MKIRKKILGFILYIIMGSLGVTYYFTPVAIAKDSGVEKIKFIQTIQDQLSQAAGIKTVTVYIVTEKKRKIKITPSSISLSYGFLNNIENINQLVAVMAHLTAYIRLGYSVPPPVKSKNTTLSTGRTSLGDYLKSALHPEALDQGYIPRDKGTFQRDATGAITRPQYQNRAYDYAVNKTNIIATEHKLAVDRSTDKIMRHAGFCPGDYSRLLHYLYNNPQKFRGSKYFSLGANQWQRIDVADRRADPAASCSKIQMAQTQKYSVAFRQLEIKVIQWLNSRKTD